MSSAAEFDIGSEVAGSDGVCGVLTRLVVDPVARAVTHLVVEPRHGRGNGHLVPIRYVTTAGTPIELSCTQAEFAKFERAEETDYLAPPNDLTGYTVRSGFSRGPGPGLGVGPGSTNLWVLPYWRLPVMSGGGPGKLVTHDRVPLGEVDVRRGDAVHATDGEIGRIDGLVIEPEDHHVTHILLQEGHIWHEKQVAIPIGAVTRVGDTIRLSLSKDEVRDLPPVDADHPLA